VDGYCCNSDCAGGCNACNLAGAEGTCTVMPDGSAGSPTCSPYLCDGMFQTCPTTCVMNDDCIVGHSCDNNLCKQKKLDGATCQNGNQCASGFCVDGFCCNTACVGNCGACNVAGVLGTCTAYAPGDPGSPSCSPYLCDGASLACPTTCDDSVPDCVPSHYCDQPGLPTSSCQPDQGNGQGCTNGNECASGFCPTEDLVCCADACSGTCESCLGADTGGSDGLCGFVEYAQDPADECGSQLCNGAGSCDCGLQPTPPGGACPMPCTSCNGSTCLIDCSVGGACSGATITCPVGFDCDIKCNGNTTCKNKTVQCPADYACNVECNCGGGDVQCCQNTIINCSTDGPCALTCGSGAQQCQGTSLNCGDNECSASCSGIPKPNVFCGSSCDCTGC
jgi:hypothetical protein